MIDLVFKFYKKYARNGNKSVNKLFIITITGKTYEWRSQVLTGLKCPVIEKYLVQGFHYFNNPNND